MTEYHLWSLLTGLLLFLVCIIEAMEEPFLRIGAWNLKRFGKAKMGDETKVQLILEVLVRYDVILIMEVVDSSGEALEKLLEKMNAVSSTTEYTLEKSPRLGRTTYREEYAFIYRADKLEVVRTLLYADPEDVFQFEPYTVIFASPTGMFDNFAVMPLHSKPDEAETEIDALVDVCDTVVSQTSMSDIIMIGDFNAGCSYVTNKEWSTIRLKKEKRFKWMIDDRTDTTTANSICPYDRIVLLGENLKSNVLPHSAKPYYFDEAMELTSEQTEDLTDHYPVEIQLMTNRAKEMITVALTKNMEVTHPISPASFDNLKLATGRKQCSLVFTETGGVTGSWEVSSADKIQPTLDCLTAVEESVVSGLQIETLALWAQMENIQSQTNFTVSATCASCTNSCTVKVSYPTAVINKN